MVGWPEGPNTAPPCRSWTRTHGHTDVASTRGPKQHVPAWIAPPESITKINVDAAISKNTGRAVAAAIARDETGIFQGASVLSSQY